VDITNRYKNCIAHGFSEGNLLLGDDKTALFDCGSIFCAKETIENVKNALNGRPLDYIIASHIHFDHIGALPFFRQEWPDMKFVTSALGAELLLKDTPRRVIREMSIDAANTFAPEALHLCDEYDEAAFYADEVVNDGDVIELGGVSVHVLKTAGHTKDCISFYVPELHLLIANETLGIPGRGDSIFPSYLVSLNDTLDAISRCKAMAYKHLSVPHKGLIADDLAASYFDRAEKSMHAFRDLILDLYDRGASEEEILTAYAEKFNYPRPPDVIKANDRLTMMCTLRDCGRI